MQAIILAAGKGTRMGLLTNTTPKPLVKVADKPIIEYIFELLSSYGVTEVGINLFYLGDQITNFLGDGSKYGIKTTYIKEKFLTGTAGGMKAVMKILKPRKPFFVIPGDWIGNYNLKSIYQSHIKSQGLLTMCAFYKPLDPIKDCGVMLFDRKTNKLIKYVQKPKVKEEIISYWANTGVYVCDPRIKDFIPNQIEGSKIVDLPTHIVPKILSSSEKINVYQVNRNKYFQLGINSQEQIRIAEIKLVY